MLTADQTVAVLTGMRTLTIATVTAHGQPRISAVDGHFLRFSCSRPRAAQPRLAIRARPAVSVAHVVGDDLGVFVHGRAEFLDPAHADFAGVEAPGRALRQLAVVMGRRHRLCARPAAVDGRVLEPADRLPRDRSS